jgi:polyribonucleotide nucleotidyltransferase
MVKLKKNMFTEKTFSKEWLGHTLTIKTGKLAKQADAAVTVQYGDTVVMATVVEASEEREGVSFFPLMVDFEEKLYAAGIIKGSRWVKREGRPTDASILTGRMIDRTIRPLFDDESRKDVQVIITVLSVDQENDFDIVSLIAASAALSISGVNWDGPVGGTRVGRIDNEFVFNPTYDEQAKSDLDLIVAGTEAKTIMIECGANELKEDIMEKALFAGQKKLQGSIELIKELKEKFAVKTKTSKPQLLDESEKEAIEEEKKALEITQKWLDKNVKNMLFDQKYHSKEDRKAVVKNIENELDKYLFNQGLDKKTRNKFISKLAYKNIEKQVSKAILEDNKRVDGRNFNEIRELNSEVSILPRNHGVGLFSRGETQVMSVLTLGSPALEQSLEGLEGPSTKRFMHHYNFPPYSVGEAKPLRGTGRREVGHGALAEKALIPVLPSKDDFPYTIRIVSETLGSNGSSSMASTCASSLSLMDAGVPIKTAVAGIAIGLASNSDMSKWKILTDIQDLEDGEGGMDFKITGTETGITAIQLDTKTDGLNEDIIHEALQAGRLALDKILKNMNKTISRPNPELSPYAPKLLNLHIKPEKIGMVIGPGGKMINKIIELTDCEINIEEDGLVVITGQDIEKLREAENMIKEIVHEFEPGEIIEGEVVNIMDFGAFVKLNKNQDGLVHISELAPYRVNKTDDVVKIGDLVKVKIKEVDDNGKIKLSMKELQENEKYWSKAQANNNNSKHRQDKPKFKKPFFNKK